MKSALRPIALALAIVFLTGCVATVPVKVAAKGAKLGVKTAKTGVKATTAAGAALIPDGDKDQEPSE
ncbi:hypothetical protein [Pelagicoccus sp. SDUM812003]|uniref:hypothetical protein n=1 Tax=Pelagicoccus sp. SDUM812003 TaxID=3041267 RepID=UPI00280CB234|nr:hypothetical protein [Pelagicoccus sp. SDUM812003]MDQ8205614.1 hypothetical protein [Pelagicoccus sp. SDUM812003]